ncbi:MAG: 50S ribosomal protein L10 [Nanoarchaeota archaeon]|nr:50S ribosomal protein L10 [Nanoarchaeota archaeon]MBU0977548.1 50S ribosomal protein L10 [Nanoarchaeota archaeon]
MAAKKETTREKPVPESKIKSVEKIAKMMKESKTVFIASIKGLPASKYQKIKKNLRGKAEVLVAKKSLVLRAIDAAKKGHLSELKGQVGADVCFMFSQVDAFELSGILMDNQTPANAKAGDIAPEDITVEPGPTSLVPGPAISELGSVGIRVVVEEGKLAIKQPATLVRSGEVINAKVASVLAKLNISPMRVGFIPVAAYDGEEDKVYREIKVDKEGTLEELRTAIGRALGFAVNLGYTVKETIKFFISKAVMEEKALGKIYNEKSGKPAEEPKTEEKPVETAPTEEKKDEPKTEEVKEDGK